MNESTYNTTKQRLMDSTSLFVRAYPTSYQLLSDSVAIGQYLLQHNMDHVDAIPTAVIELFPNRKYNRFDNIQYMVVSILTDYMCVACTASEEVATLAYNDAVNHGIDTMPHTTSTISSKAVNNYIANSIENLPQSSINFQRELRCTDEAAKYINFMVNESVNHFYLG